MMERRNCLPGCALGALLALPSARVAAQAIICVSIGDSATAGAYGGGASAVSADGRFVAFDSYATGLVTGDANRTWDVFLRNVAAGTTQRVSISDGLAQGNAPSHTPAISADGRYVAFWSKSSNLVTGDTNNAWDVFVRDTGTGTTRRVSLSAYGAEGAGDAEPDRGLSISADGQRIAFRSTASNLVSDDTNGAADIFVRDVQANTTTRVSVTAGGAQANAASADPAISADGRRIAFSSFATNLVASDTNAASDVFMRDLEAGATQRVSVSNTGAEANGYSYQPAISADGRYVAFESHAANLVTGDTNQMGDVFVRDTQAEKTQRVSVAPGGGSVNGASFKAGISADGRVITFASFASDLTVDGSGAVWSVFARDVSSGTTVRVGLPARDDLPAFASDLPALSPDGRYVAFQSEASYPLDDLMVSRYDVFLRDLAVPVNPPYTMADAAAAFHIAAGLASASPEDTQRLNVAKTDISIGIGDALHIARKAAGLEPNP